MEVDVGQSTFIMCATPNRLIVCLPNDHASGTLPVDACRRHRVFGMPARTTSQTSLEDEPEEGFHVSPFLVVLALSFFGFGYKISKIIRSVGFKSYRTAHP